MTVSKLLSTAFCSERAFREHVSPDSLFQQALPSFCSVQSLLPAYFRSVKMARRTKIFSPAHTTVQQAPLPSATALQTYRYVLTHTLTHTHTHTHTHTIAAVLATNGKYTDKLNFMSLVLFYGSKLTASPLSLQPH